MNMKKMRNRKGKEKDVIVELACMMVAWDAKRKSGVGQYCRCFGIRGIKKDNKIVADFMKNID